MKDVDANSAPMLCSLHNHGQPTAPGWYWVNRVGNRCTPAGKCEIVEVVQDEKGGLWCDGFGEMEMREIAFAWQPVEPPTLMPGPVCFCNQRHMVKHNGDWWCPHMEKPEAVDVELHQRWQRANALPPFLCKYPE